MNFFKYIQENQPVSITGAIAHSYYWLTTLGWNDIVYKNPNFKADAHPNGGIVLVCVPGTADQPGSFMRIVERLLKKDLADYISTVYIVAFNHRYQGKGIRFFSQQLIDKIKAYGHKDVILMGHSRGGLIISEAAEYRTESAGIRVHALFPICAPFNGSPLAMEPLSSVSTSVRQMEPNSPFLQKLNEDIGNSSLYYCFIGAEEDGIVPPEYAYVKDYVDKHPESRILFDRHTHLSIMSSHRMVDFMDSELAKIGQGLQLQSPEPTSQKDVSKGISGSATPNLNATSPVYSETIKMDDLFDDFVFIEPEEHEENDHSIKCRF
nr:alpha/beta hydrolase [Legionella jordanis]